jgi:hypothetical protein
MVHVYKGTIGADLSINVRNDLTDAASCDIRVKLPNDSIVVWTPDTITVVSEISSIIDYETVDGDLDVAGDYTVHVKVYLTDGKVFFCDAFVWKIYDDFEVP